MHGVTVNVLMGYLRPPVTIVHTCLQVLTSLYIYVFRKQSTSRILHFKSQSPYWFYSTYHYKTPGINFDYIQQGHRQTRTINFYTHSYLQENEIKLINSRFENLTLSIDQFFVYRSTLLRFASIQALTNIRKLKLSLSGVSRCPRVLYKFRQHAGH